MHVDHITAIAKGGRHEFANWQLLHATCNRRKQTLPMKGRTSPQFRNIAELNRSTCIDTAQLKARLRSTG